jgi:hypothetical protein
VPLPGKHPRENSRNTRTAHRSKQCEKCRARNTLSLPKKDLAKTKKLDKNTSTV